MRTIVDKVRQVLGLDMAIVWSLIVQGVGLVRSPINIVFILAFLTKSEQGLWYTFASLSALTMLADLGFTMVITQFVSHSYASIDTSTAERDAYDWSGFHSLVKTSVVAYSLVTLAAVVLLSIVGLIYFSTESRGVRLIWLVYSALSGVRLMQGLLAAIYQGLDKVKEMQINAFWGVLATSAVTWGALAAGAGLWSVVIGLATGTTLAMALLYRLDPRLWRDVFSRSTLRTNALLRETLPLQARYAVSWISGYVLFSLAVPAAFKFAGKAEAGALGASLAIVAVVNSIAGSWVSTKVPRMNMLASGAREDELYHLTKETMLRAIAVHVALSGGVIGALSVARLVVPSFASRFLSLDLIAVVLVGQLAQTIVNTMAVYVRAHKRDPLMQVSVLSAALMMVNVILVMRPYGLAAFLLCECILLWLITLPLCGRTFMIETRRYRQNCASSCSVPASGGSG